jgi:serine/threonine protein kinase
MPSGALFSRIKTICLAAALSAAVAILAPWAVAGCSLERVSKALLDKYDHTFPKIQVAFDIDHDTRVVLPEGAQKQLGIKSFEVIRRIGWGGSSTVYVVKAELLDGSLRDMVWRAINPKVLDLLGPMEREGALLQDFTRKVGQDAAEGPVKSHIVPVHGRIALVGPTGHRTEGYLMDLAGPSVAKLISGGDLSLAFYGMGIRLTRGNRWESSRVIHNIERFAGEVASVLAELAQTGIVHQDLKPENLLLTGGTKNDVAEWASGKSRIGLIDFGGAVPVGWSEFTVGTPAFMAPEALQGTLPQASAAMDLYSYSVMLANALGGLDTMAYGRWGHDPAAVETRFKSVRASLEAERVPKEDLDRFDQLSALALQGLKTAPQSRIDGVRSLDSPYLRISAEGKVLGPAR